MGCKFQNNPHAITFLRKALEQKAVGRVETFFEETFQMVSQAFSEVPLALSNRFVLLIDLINS